MKGLRLYKQEKLCGQTRIDTLFNTGQSTIAFPLRAVFRFREADNPPARFLVTIPKKKIRHAVQRVLLRRRTREAFRLLRHKQLYPNLSQTRQSVDIALIYLDNHIANYQLIEQQLDTILLRITQAIPHADTQPCDTSETS